VLVVDNGSSDGSPEAAEQLGCRVLRLESNQGFARAVNEGIRSTTSEWVAILNNDVEIPPGWLEELMAALTATPEAAYASGKLYRRGSTTLDSTFDLVARSGCAWRAGHGRDDSPIWNEQRTVSMVSLTAAVCRRELFERIGYLDEDFESYLEDVDFGMRCALRGEKGLYVPSAVGWHEGSATLGVWHQDTVRRISRNQVLLVAKHYPGNWLLRYGWPVLVGQLLWGMVAARHGAAGAYLWGKLDGIRLWRKVRRTTTDCERFGEFVVRSEHQIRALQQKTGFDPYWRVYFALT
ncbi:MAG: glycosyltransferase family 2 protein, partial [Acidobacteria bacterium]|nr:glycosyltransferase family 2 protein [Acidobacteriota bacterium]